MNKPSDARSAPTTSGTDVRSYWIDIALGCLALLGTIALLTRLAP